MTHATAGARRAALLCATLLACLPRLLPAQTDSATVAAGERYRAGRLHELLLGGRYRDLWTAPVRVPVLAPDTFAGGLTVVSEGGGFSTRSLRMRGGDGREYVFRSVDKDVSRGFGPEMRGTLAEWIVQDQVAAKHPAAVLAVPPILEAGGVLHVVPRLFLLPDHPFLGEHRARYAGMLGTVEERPDEGDEDADGAGFAGAVRVAGTDRLLEHLEETPRNRVDARAYLAARLLDLFLGDWDRHEDQWRWARFDVDGVRLWRPVPRDRDNAFVSHEGLLMAAARAVFPRNVRFREEYPDVFGLTVHATALDRRLLSELPKPVWDSTAAALRARLGDRVIDSAAARIPPEYRALQRGEMERILRARRERLPAVAAEFYAQLASDVDVHATDEDEVAEVDRREGGVVEVRLYRRDRRTGARAAEPYFRRAFRRGETREVRVYLRGGDDRAVVRGDVERSLTVRVIGGGGDDVLADSSRVRGGGARTALYDHRGENRFLAGPRTRVDRRRWTEPEDSSTLTGVRAYRDWGKEGSDFTPWAGWKSNVGVVAGGGPVATRYGFRREPHARRVWLRGLYAPGPGRFGAEAAGDFRRAGSGGRVELFARASDFEVTRFHGFGNETPGEGGADFRVWERQLLLAPLLHLRAGGSTGVFLGPALRHALPRASSGSPAAEARPRGSEEFGHAGVRAGVELDTRDSPSFPTGGVALRAVGGAYPAAWGDAGAFAGAELTGSAYLTAPAGPRPTLALRAGARGVRGGFPLQEAAFLGGSGTLRGYPHQRYAGDAAVFGNAELRLPVAPVNLGVRGEVGVLALADAGRVFAGGESSSAWHTSYGGGLWGSFLGRSRTFSVSYARGDAGRLYFWSGFPF